MKEERGQFMIKKEYQITDFNELIGVMNKCDVCTLAVNNGEVPYIIPMNFGVGVEDENAVLYFHGANHGTKLELFNRNKKVSFEMNCNHCFILYEEKMTCTMGYESVIGQGRIEFVPEEEKLKDLRTIMEHYHIGKFDFDKSVLPKVTVYKLVVENMTGKRRNHARQV